MYTPTSVSATDGLICPATTLFRSEGSLAAPPGLDLRCLDDSGDPRPARDHHRNAEQIGEEEKDEQAGGRRDAPLDRPQVQVAQHERRDPEDHADQPAGDRGGPLAEASVRRPDEQEGADDARDRKSTRLNSSP